jgi:hypothetical protein
VPSPDRTATELATNRRVCKINDETADKHSHYSDIISL